MAGTSNAHPIGVLRDLVTTLEAAITVTLADPKTKPVHQLRTTARRIEAQLELLSLLPDLPKHAKPAKRARKLLRKLRRAAGRVRDLDIQRDLTKSKSPDAHRLRSLFKQQREKEAERLLDIIHKHQPKLTRALEALLKALASAEDLALSAPRLVELTLHWYTHHVPASAQTPDEFHAIRKSAKLARYMAESPTEPIQSTRKLAQTFESLQQSGGAWHDWLTLSDIAHRELGSSSTLTQSFAHNCEKSLAAYQRHLKSLPKTVKL
jgi:CHAD domain-containing protein